MHRLGITIFDITDPSDVRYCFVDFYGMESERAVDLMTPLSARTYLEAYYEIDATDDDVGLLPLLDSFQGRNLVTVEALEETWPSEYWQGHDSVEDVEGSHPQDPSGTESKGFTGNPQTNSIKSLREQSMDNFLGLLLDPTQDTTALLAEVELLNDFIPKLRRRLYDEAATLSPSDIVLNLLYKALSQDVEVDLSPFSMLPVEHISTLVGRLRNGKMRSLNLSNMTHITDSDLEAILKARDVSSTQEATTMPVPAPTMAGDLTSVILLDTPNISLDFIADHLGHCDVYHTGLFRRALHVPYKYGRDEEMLSILSFKGADIVSQMVWVGISSAQSCDGQLRTAEGHFDWNNLKFSAKDRYLFDTPKTLEYKNFLLDIPMPVSKTLQGLQRLLRYLGAAELAWVSDWTRATARCLATTSTLGVAAAPNCGIGPLSAELYNVNCQGYHNGVEPRIGQFLQANQWAIVLIYEAFDVRDQDRLDSKFQSMLKSSALLEEPGSLPAGDKVDKTTYKPQKRLRYALAKALTQSESSTAQYLVADVPGYIKHVWGDRGAETDRLNAWWASESSAFDGAAGYYDDDDLQACLRRIYSHEGFGLTSPAELQGASSIEDAMKKTTIS